MDDKYDLRELIFSTFDSFIPSVLEGTPLEESSGAIAFGAATFAVVNIVFLMLFFFTVRNFMDRAKGRC